MGATLPSLGYDLFAQLMGAHGLTVAVGGSVGFPLLARYWLSDWLSVIGLRGRPAELIIRSAPVLVMAVLIPLSAAMSFEAAGVSWSGTFRAAFLLSAPPISWPLIQELALPAFLIALIGFIESVSVGKTLGAKRRQRIDPDQELVGLGAANTAAALSGFRLPEGFRDRSSILMQGLKPRWHQCWPHSALRWQRYFSPQCSIFSQGCFGGYDCCRCDQLGRF